MKQLTITQDASYSYEGNCLYYDGGTNTCTVSGCYLKACPMSSSYWGGALYAPFWSSYMPANDNTFNNNLITGGYYGLYFEGYPWYWAGVGTYSGDIITNNIIDSVGQYGLYCIGGGDNNVISGNKIDMTSSNNQAGIFMEECPATSGSEFKVFNNFITVRGGSGYGLFTDYDMDNCWFMYNNINVTSGSDAAHFDYDYTSSCTVENNNFVNSGGGYAYFVSYSWGNPIGTSDYNNMYTTGSYVASMDYSGLVALSDWQSYTGWDANSVSTDPGYNTSTDLHTTGAGIDGKATPISGITTDIDGATRNSSTPDIGADEFTPVNDDAGITAVTNPTGNYCPGTQTIMATLKDAGVHTLTSCLLTYKVNGTTIGTYTWGGSLTTGSSASVPVGTYSFTSGTYSVDVISSKPNGVTDLNPVNDQASVSGLHQGMSGTKTIALTGSPDYSSFTAAINDLKLGGLCGAVVFNVGNGSYNENPSFGQQVISNASSTNTITFQSASGDSSKAIVDASFTYNYYSALFDLTNTSWVILNKL